MGDRDHYLHGADDVRSAANTIRSAADAMSSTASTMSDAASRFANTIQEQQMFLTEWLRLLDEVLTTDREARRAMRDGR